MFERDVVERVVRGNVGWRGTGPLPRDDEPDAGRGVSWSSPLSGPAGRGGGGGPGGRPGRDGVAGAGAVAGKRDTVGVGFFKNDSIRLRREVDGEGGSLGDAKPTDDVGGLKIRQARALIPATMSWASSEKPAYASNVSRSAPCLYNIISSNHQILLIAFKTRARRCTASVRLRVQ